MKVSLRNQLSLLIGLGVMVIVFISIFVTQQITVWNMENTLDENIQKRANMVASIISSDITTDEESYAEVISDLAGQELTFVPSQLRLISPDGNIIVEFGKMTNSTIRHLDSQMEYADLSAGRYSTILTEGNFPLRTYTVSVIHPQTRILLAYVQIIESLNQIEEAKQVIWRNGLIIGLIGSLLTITVGQILIRRGFKPLYTLVKEIDKADYYHLKSSMQEDMNSLELQQLSKSLAAMWLRLDLAVSDKRKVIGSMSHDLRTPLTALQGQLEVLLEQPSLSVENRESVKRMLNETRRLIRMVKNMLINVQLDANPAFMVEDVNLKYVVDQIIQDMWVLTEGRIFEINAPDDVMVRGSRDLIIQMLMNVVDNAIKFTPKEGKIELSLTRDKDYAILEVSDTGRGIPSEQLPHVTEAFYRVGNSRKSEGEGARLGLAIVKQIVDLHQGRTEIQSRMGYGTSVTIYLPFQNKIK